MTYIKKAIFIAVESWMVVSSEQRNYFNNFEVIKQELSKI